MDFAGDNTHRFVTLNFVIVAVEAIVAPDATTHRHEDCEP